MFRCKLDVNGQFIVLQAIQFASQTKFSKFVDCSPRYQVNISIECFNHTWLAHSNGSGKFSVLSGSNLKYSDPGLFTIKLYLNSPKL